LVADAKSHENDRGTLNNLGPEDAKEKREFRGGFSGRERNNFFIANQETGRFSDVSYCAGLDFMEDGRAVAPLDFDSDGDLDLVTLGLGGIRLLMNTTNPKRTDYLRIRFDDVPHDLGIRARVWMGRRKQVGKVSISAGFHTQTSPDLHFGLGESSQAQRIHLAWPDGAKRIVKDLHGYVKIGKTGRVTLLKVRPWPRVMIASQGNKRTKLARTLAGEKKPILAKSGVPTIVNFWAPWCEACKREFPQLKQLAHTAKDKIRIVGISVETKKLDQVKSFVSKYQPGFEIMFADDQIIADYFGEDGEMQLPATFIFDEEQRLIRSFRNEISAKRIFFAVGRMNPSAEDYRALGVTLNQPKQEQESIKALTRSAELAPKNGTAKWRLGYAFLRVKNYKLAVKALQEAHRVTPEDPEILVDLATAYGHVGRSKKMRRTLEKAVLVGGSARAHNEYGLALEKEDLLQEAAIQFKQSIDINASYYVALVNLRRIRAKQRNGPAVRSISERLIRLGHTDKNVPIKSKKE
jgi:thiol-disulfide isomerase/thioredoxin